MISPSQIAALLAKYQSQPRPTAAPPASAKPMIRPQSSSMMDQMRTALAQRAQGNPSPQGQPRRFGRAMMRSPLQRFADGGLVEDEQDAEGGGAFLVPTQETPTATSQDFMRQMLEQYAKRGEEDQASVAAAQQEYARQRAAQEALLDQAAKRQAAGPSRSEMFFDLARAFGTPGKTGSFFEQAGAAGQVLADRQREERARQASDAANTLSIGLQRGQLGLTDAKDRLTAARQNITARDKTMHQLALEQMKASFAAGKPQSEAGKIALDSGLQPGTPQFGKFVNDYVKQKMDSGDLYKQAMLAVAQGRFALDQSKADTAKASAAKLTPAEVKMKAETEDGINALDNAYAWLRVAAGANKDAYTSSLADQAQAKAERLSGSKSKRLAATTELENALQQQTLDTLKARFGGAPTEGERDFALLVSGLGTATPESRAGILKQAASALARGKKQRQKRLEEISSGQYRVTTPDGAETGPGLDEEPLGMDDLGAP